MEIRNLLEDAVLSLIDELFATEEKDKRLGFCTCGQCRLDVACYVLNRIKPEYIVSSRGLAYRERDSLERVQRRADIITTAKEGWARVSHQPRATADHALQRIVHDLPEGPAFNFPTVMGRAFNGLNFEPLASGEVRLLMDGKPLPMVDANWQNPFVLAQATAGTFIFWPRPQASKAAGEESRFAFELCVEVPGFDPVSHYFELDLASDRAAKDEFSLQRVHKIPDLYLFPR
ncbi:MAG: late competence development ComFB family protein [Spirochaetaceae bacterium]|nr:late competence development ComFB family protein [Spirochaetaceae bacterium]